MRTLVLLAALSMAGCAGLDEATGVYEPVPEDDASGLPDRVDRDIDGLRRMLPLGISWISAWLLTVSASTYRRARRRQLAIDKLEAANALDEKLKKELEEIL